MKLKLFGPRVLLEKEKPAQKGLLVMPEDPRQIHALARVRVVGDGKTASETKTMLVKEDDIVLFQTNAIIASACSYELSGKTYLNLHQADLIARLPDTHITMEALEMLGDWVLVEPYLRQTGRILLPATINYQEHLEHTYWRFIKAAPGSDLAVADGQEVLIDASRASPVQLGSKTYCYLDKRSILGVCDETHEALTALAT